MKLKMQVTSVVLTASALCAFTSQARAQTIPYRTTGIGVYSPSSGNYGGSGAGVPLGRLTFSGNVAVFPTANPLVFDFYSTIPQETLGASGDMIYFTSSGQVELIPLNSQSTIYSAIWTGQFVVAGGTGRFANVGPAAHPLSVIAINVPFTFADPEWTFFWGLDGSIELSSSQAGPPG